jgi:hypothetical protein
MHGHMNIKYVNTYFIGCDLFVLFSYLEDETYKTRYEDDCHCSVSHITFYTSLTHHNRMNATENQHQHAIQYVPNAGFDKSWTPGYYDA